MTTDTEQQETALETWTYMGQRLDRNGKLNHLWLDPRGEERAYLKVVIGTAIGARYEVQALDGGRQVRGRPRFLDAGDPDDPRRAQWELDHRTSVTARDLRARERRAAQENTFGAMTLDQLREKMAGSFGAPRTAMLAQILRYLGA